MMLGMLRRVCVLRRTLATLPRHTVVKMPALSPTMTAGHVGEWQKTEGDAITAGDVLVDIETDKATLGLEAQDDGVLARILLKTGTRDVPVGKPLAVVVEKAGDVAAFKDYTANDDSGAAQTDDKSGKDSAPGKKESPESPTFNEELADPADEEQAQTTNDAMEAQMMDEDLDTERNAQTHASASKKIAETKPKDAHHTAKQESHPTSQHGEAPSSPHARSVARKLGVDITAIKKGSGPGGRIVAADVEEAASDKRSRAPEPPRPAARSSHQQATRNEQDTDGYTDVPLSNMRRTIAERLVESKRTIPHFNVSMDVRVDRLMELRKRFNADHAASAESPALKISVNDFIVKAVGRALREVPDINAEWRESHIRRHGGAHVCVAVALPEGKGLVTPVVRDADTKGVAALAEEIQMLASNARAGRLHPQDMAGGTFTVSNLGMYGVSSFTAIVNPPQAAILAVGGAHARVVVDEDGDAAVAQVMTLTLGCDHRVVDGAVAAHFLSVLRGFLDRKSVV